MKINNKEILDDLTLAKVETIWRMTRDELWDFVSELWAAAENAALETSGDVNLRDLVGDELGDAIDNRSAAIRKEEERKANAQVVVDGVIYKTITYFDVYHLGWEMDTQAWIVDKDGNPALVHSNHGHTYFVEGGIAFLQAKIKELSANVKAMKNAVTQLEING